MSQTSALYGAVLLAAGKGTRMHSDRPKVLQPMLEEPMLRYVYDAVTPLLGERALTVVGHRSDMVRAAFPGQEDRFVEQAEQLGTGHALSLAWPRVLAAAWTHVLVINGDTPLISGGVLRGFLESSLERDADIAFITLSPADPGALGLVLRDGGGGVAGIVEAKDYDEKRHGPRPREINAGIYCLKTSAVSELLPLLDNANRSGEYYLTDLVGHGVRRGLTVLGLSHGDDPSLLGINSPAELIRSEELLRARLVEEHLGRGVIIRAPGLVRIGPDVRIAPGADLTGPCELYGRTVIGAGARIASHCRLQDAELAQDVTVHAFCHIQGAAIGPRCLVGPYARLRPEAVLEEGAHIGNFVEMKKARLGKGAKASHLSYLGDAEIGPRANIGAGTITCNYDGKNKHQTSIGEDAFIGSNTALVAPVRVGDKALIGAGSVITKDVPDGQLALTRAPQRMLPRN